jgi:hypothetical protein
VRAVDAARLSVPGSLKDMGEVLGPRMKVRGGVSSRIMEARSSSTRLIGILGMNQASEEEESCQSRAHVIF